MIPKETRHEQGNITFSKYGPLPSIRFPKAHEPAKAKLPVSPGPTSSQTVPPETVPSHHCLREGHCAIQTNVPAHMKETPLSCFIYPSHNLQGLRFQERFHRKAGPGNEHICSSTHLCRWLLTEWLPAAQLCPGAGTTGCVATNTLAILI